jgi:phosphoribosylformimino-5-aminoimidazole carboxamide ribotide isomerase
MPELIPAIDIIDGKCVRLEQGIYARKKEYSMQPVDVARQFEDMGIRRLHLVDLDGARAGHVVNLGPLEDISGNTSLEIDFGGGVKSDEDIRKVFKAGAAMVTAGSIAVKQPNLVKEWLHRYGPDRIILGADARERMIAIQGWEEETGIGLFPYIKAWKDAGIRKVICTDIMRDGMLGGPSLELYRELGETFPDLEIIASGGVSSMQDILELEKTGIRGIIFGKAYYEGKITSEEIGNYMKTS